MNQPLHPRQIDIMSFAKREGRVDVESLATHFKVTPQTIRRDLNDLCDAERLHRVHGGAVYPSNTSNLAYLARREIAADEKQRIARVVAELIPDGASVILNIGTTTELVAHELRSHQDLLVVTNNLNVALILSDAPNVDLIVSGGMVRKSDGGIVGAAAVDLISQFKVDYAIIGVSAIDEDGALLDFDYQEVRVSRAILDQARTRILVADNTKFDRRAPVQIGQVSELDVFVTDASPSANITEICDENGVRILIAGDASAHRQSDAVL